MNCPTVSNVAPRAGAWIETDNAPIVSSNATDNATDREVLDLLEVCKKD